MDQNARYRNRHEVFRKETFFGQLEHVIVLNLTGSLPGIPADSSSCGSFLLGIVRTCSIQESNDLLDIHYYTHTGRYEVVDIKNVQCLVGRILDRGQWAIVDRSGGLARAFYVEDDEDEGHL